VGNLQLKTFCKRVYDSLLLVHLAANAQASCTALDLTRIHR